MERRMRRKWGKLKRFRCSGPGITLKQSETTGRTMRFQPSGKKQGLTNSIKPSLKQADYLANYDFVWRSRFAKGGQPDGI